ncbi:MAG: membrane protein insertion efficiency factor YidD [Lachnospiraceae bacterium]|nr:membrane protein insertion efficiency factor YidD [Lachnospiraceae bacterium]
MKIVLIGFIKLYKLIKSGVSTTPHCRYYPTCSNYGLEAIEKYGAWKGFGLTIWRVLRCNPFVKGGYDPVP